jgi:hypothetical protein
MAAAPKCARQQLDALGLRQPAVVGTDFGRRQQLRHHRLEHVGVLAQVEGGAVEAEGPHRALQGVQAVPGDGGVAAGVERLRHDRQLGLELGGTRVRRGGTQRRP